MDELSDKVDRDRLSHMLTFLVAAMGDISGLEATAERSENGSSPLEPLKGQLQKAYSRCRQFIPMCGVSSSILLAMQRGMMLFNQERSRLSQLAVAVKQYIEASAARYQRKKFDPNRGLKHGEAGQSKLSFQVVPQEVPP